MTRRPTTYKASYEQQHRRQHLERRVEAMQQEIDALKCQLHVVEGRTNRDEDEGALARAQYEAYRKWGGRNTTPGAPW